MLSIKLINYRFIIGLLVFLWCGVAWADAQRVPINEYSTRVMKLEGGGYTEIGAGINYQKDDGSWGASVAEFKPSSRSGIQWECYTTYNRVGLKNNISTGAYSVFTQLGNTGKILKSKPVALAYLNIDTKEWQIFANIQSSTAQVNGNKIKYVDAFLNCDLEYVIEKDRLKQNLYIKSRVGFPVSPYPANKTYVVIVTKFDLANYELPTLIDSRGGVAFNDVGDEADEFHFSKQNFTMTTATDNLGATRAIKKRLVKYNGEHYLLEGLPYSWLATASYPVLLDYTTINSNLTGDQSWTSGTYYIVGDLTCSGSIAVSAGVIVKFGSGASMSSTDRRYTTGLWEVSGTIANPAYFTSFNDNSVGETITGSSGSPAAGDYDSINSTSGDQGGTQAGSITGVIYRYATTAINCSWPYTNGSTPITFTDSVISNMTNGFTSPQGTKVIHCYLHTIPNSINAFWNGSKDSVFYNCATNANQLCIQEVGVVGGTYSMSNMLIVNSAIGIKTNLQYGATHNWTNFTFINCDTAIWTSNDSGNPGTFNIKNSIFQDCTIALDRDNGTLNSTYNVFYNNGTDYSGTVSDKTGDQTATNPVFATGTMSGVGTGILDSNVDDYFLNQSTSPCKDAGSDTAANLSMNTYTTATDKTLDSSTVDIGYHYDPDDVASETPPATSNWVMMVN